MGDEDTDGAAETTAEAAASAHLDAAPSDAPASFESPQDHTDPPIPPSETIPEEPKEPEPLGSLGNTLPAQPPVDVDPGYNSRGVPTFESVREKIETRYGNSLGATELASETAEARTLEEQYDARQKAAAERLEQIRESMHPKDDS